MNVLLQQKNKNTFKKGSAKEGFKALFTRLPSSCDALRNRGLGATSQRLNFNSMRHVLIFEAILNEVVVC